MEPTSNNNEATRVIHQFLRQLEQKRNIKILFAADTGSRSIGLEAPTSDYDLKIIYVERMEWYLRIDEENLEHEIVERHVEASTQVNGGEIQVDVMGFNLKKCLQLLRKSNPTLLEMLSSSLVYANDQLLMDSIRSELNVYFSQKTLSFHYINVAKQNFVDYLRNKKQVNRKKYLYIVLTLLRVLYMKKKSEELGNRTHMDNGMELMDVLPPLHYQELCDPLRECGIIQSEYVNDLDYLLNRKKQESGQWDREDPMPLMYAWIEEMRRETKKYADDVLAARKRYFDTLDADQIKVCTGRLNTIFMDTLTRFDRIDAIGDEISE